MGGWMLSTSVLLSNAYLVTNSLHICNGLWIIDLSLAKSSIANLTLSLQYTLHSKQPVVIYLVTVTK